MPMRTRCTHEMARRNSAGGEPPILTSTIPTLERLAAQVAAAVWRVAVEPGATYDRALVWSIVGRACEMLREHYGRG